jgi:hypothetical protein
MGKFSRDKGKRGELDVVNKLGGLARRVGRSYVPSQADVETVDMQKSINSDQIKAIISSYWRYIRQCPVIALEVNSNLSSYSGEETADVLAVDKLRYLIETEVKVSLADLRRDIEKEKQRDFSEG